MLNSLTRGNEVRHREPYMGNKSHISPTHAGSMIFEQYPGSLGQRSANNGLFLNEIQDKSRRGNCSSVLSYNNSFLFLDISGL